MNVTWSNSLGKVVFFFGLCGIQILKVTYISSLGKVFKSLTKKIHRFQRFKNFQRFRVFVLSYRPNSKDGNDGKLSICLNSVLIYISLSFKTDNYVFLLKKASLVWSNVTFRCFWRFRRIYLAVSFYVFTAFFLIQFGHVHN